LKIELLFAIDSFYDKNKLDLTTIKNNLKFCNVPQIKKLSKAYFIDGEVRFVDCWVSVEWKLIFHNILSFAM